MAKARVTIHLNGKRRGVATPMLKSTMSHERGTSTLAREAIAQAASLQSVQAGGVIDHASASFDTHWGSMQRTYHPEHDTPEAHEAAAHVMPNGKVETLEHRVRSDRFVRTMGLWRSW